MIDCVSVDNMRNSDFATINAGTTGRELMHRAAIGIFRAVNWHGKIAIVAGSGNNGGDGFALACILQNNGFASVVFCVSERFSDDSFFYAERAKAKGILLKPFTSGCLDGYDMIVDCLLGTGFAGNLRESYVLAVQEINQACAFVVSADINSGLNGDTGEGDTAVKSDVTVAIGYVKNGLVSSNAGRFMKRLVCVDIGIELLKHENYLCSEDELLSFCGNKNGENNNNHVRIGKSRYICYPKWFSGETICVR